MATIGQLQLAYPTGVTVAFEKPCSAVEMVNCTYTNYAKVVGDCPLPVHRLSELERTDLGEQFYCGKYVHCGLTLGPEKDVDAIPC